jgi:hypothetical protein
MSSGSVYSQRIARSMFCTFLKMNDRKTIGPAQLLKLLGNMLSA